MYLLAHTSILISCPVQRAFDFAANLENFSTWFPGVIAIASDDGLPFTAVGKQYRETVAMPLRGRREVSIRVKEAVSPHRLVTEGALATLLPRMEIDFHERGPDACEMTWRMLSRNRALLPRWTVLPLARRVMARRAAVGLRRLKARLERG
ncbi:SRPBCC family protein [Piscinibacter sp. HJYY11]|uniref:SRPBCC family protein n=1 Tax=Piscinibacter sp. HJYY11 TaxID=2801333 RepID=UPI00191FF366|nr:SRPBCC family protein [Piscinibacter sp. HJYY11]MBL0728581.1 SRPBCC family protein [Piscinibacter sp. HJYY11]